MFKIFKQTENGMMLLIDKPIGYSSARIVNIIKKKLKVKKAGHSGTLDPKATGLLVVCTDKMTKVLNEFLNADKVYEGIMILGATTKSYDTETEITERNSISHLTHGDIKIKAEEWVGNFEQIPPMFSAVKYKGKPLYKYARKDKNIERKPKQIKIHEFEIQNIKLPEVKFYIKCSKGTYIRTLIHDFGESLGVGAYLKELRRLKIGDLDIKDSITLDSILSLN